MFRREKLKYFYTSRRRFSVILILFFFSCFHFSHGQNSTNSLYSRYGIGDLRPTNLARNLAMGGTEIGLNQPGYVNYGNPAAYSTLWFATYEAGVNFNQYNFKTSTQTHQSTAASLAYFDFAFPLKSQKAAIGFGLVPYSQVGYSVSEEHVSAYGDRELRSYEGSGGVNNFHIGGGYKLTKRFSVGLNAEYLFGSIDNERTVSFISPYYVNTSFITSTSIGWFHFKFGLQYTIDSLQFSKSDSIVMLENQIGLLQTTLSQFINKSQGDSTQEAYARKNQLSQEIAAMKMVKDSVVYRHKKTDWRMTAGFVLAPTADLHARNSELVNTYRYRIFTTPNLGTSVRDTIVNTVGEKGFVRIPLSIGFGISFVKGNRWLLCSDFSMQQWSDFSFLGAQDSLVNSWKVSAGAQFTPNDRAIKGYYKKIQYRFGFHYEKGYLFLNDRNIDDIGISAGIGMPIRNVGTILHFTVEAGNRGTTENDLMLQKYLKFTFGFTINDRWFQKTKYD